MKSRNELDDQEQLILNEMKDLPLEIRLKMMRNNMNLIKGKTQRHKEHAKDNQIAKKSKRTRGGIREEDAKQWVHRNRVKGAFSN